MSRPSGGRKGPGTSRKSGSGSGASSCDPTVLHPSSPDLARACDLLGEGLLIAESSGEIIYANPAAGRLLGLAQGDLCGRNLSFLEKESEGPASSPFAIDAAAGKMPPVVDAPAGKTGGTVLRRCRGDREVFLSMGVHPIVCPGGAGGHRAAVLRDITTEVQLEEYLIRSEKTTAIGRLVAGVAHDLNNHLTSVLGYAELLLTRNTDPRLQRGLEVIASEGGRASGIVENLLSLSRKQPPQRKPHDLNELIERALQLKTHDLRVARIDIETDLDPNLPRTNLDPHQLQKVILSLLANAEQAVRRGREGGTECDRGAERDRGAELDEGAEGRRGLVRIATRRGGSGIQVILEDDGPGFPGAVLPQIFEPFFTTRPPGAGTGLGLSICQGIVAEHGGTIRPENRAEGGARVTVELPIVGDEEVAEGPAESTQASGSAGDEMAEAGPTPEGCRSVLVVDDERTVRDVLAAMLEREGREVDVVSSGEAALEQLQSQHYDMVMSDLRMPGPGGIELYDRLVRDDPGLARRMVFITGDLTNEECEEFIQRVDNIHLAKPFTMDKLRETLRLFQERFRTG